MTQFTQVASETDYIIGWSVRMEGSNTMLNSYFPSIKFSRDMACKHWYTKNPKIQLESITMIPVFYRK